MKAFPNNRSEGMDLRDYFAAKALPLLLHASTHPWGDFHDIHAEQAYKVADAMMKARKAREKKDD
jgi:hypothetical protein